MLYSTLVVALTAGFAAAQNSSSNLPPGINNCCEVDPNTVPSDIKSSWCQAERNTCPEICGGINELAQGGQSCDTSTLEYTCECANGTTPDMSEYEQSVPGQMCRYWFDACINATDENLEQQTECRNQMDANCGTRVTDNNNSDSSSSSSATSGPTGSASGGSSGTATGAASTGSPTGAAPALKIARDYGTPLLAGGIAAVFGLAL